MGFVFFVFVSFRSSLYGTLRCRVVSMCTAEVFISCLFSCFLGGPFFSIKKNKSCVCLRYVRAPSAPSAPGFIDVRLRDMCSGVAAESLAPTLSIFFFAFEGVKVKTR